MMHVRTAKAILSGNGPFNMGPAECPPDLATRPPLPKSQNHQNIPTYLKTYLYSGSGTPQTTPRLILTKPNL